MDRVILHCDLNNFYASVECLYNPEISNKPVVVCGSEAKRHGIVLAKNYHAKKFGVKTGEPIWKAKNKCPEIIIVNPSFERYLKFSRLAKEIYKDYTDLIESFGIDECWLDITGSVKDFEDGIKLAYIIKDRIKKELGITVSVGVSFNKVFAKLGSDMKKPDAVTAISKEKFKEIIWPLPVEELLYVGGKTKRKLNRLCIYKIGELANAPASLIRNFLGKCGETLWYYANGLDNSPVSKVFHEEVVKGVGNSLTAPKDLTCDDEVKTLLYLLSDSVASRLRKHNLKGKTIQLSIKDTNLCYIERQEQLKEETYVSNDIAKKAFEIFLNSWDWSKNIRALGIRVTNLVTADTCTQISLFSNDGNGKEESLEKCIDKIRLRFGRCSIQRALLLKDIDAKDSPTEENIMQHNFIN